MCTLKYLPCPVVPALFQSVATLSALYSNCADRFASWRQTNLVRIGRVSKQADLNYTAPPSLRTLFFPFCVFLSLSSFLFLSVFVQLFFNNLNKTTLWNEKRKDSVVVSFFLPFFLSFFFSLSLSLSLFYYSFFLSLSAAFCCLFLFLCAPQDDEWKAWQLCAISVSCSAPKFVTWRCLPDYKAQTRFQGLNTITLT